MSRKNDIVNDEIEIVDIDLMDIEDRAISEISQSVKEMEDDLPVIEDADSSDEEQEQKEQTYDAVIKDEALPEEEKDKKSDTGKGKTKKTASDYIRSFLMIVAVCVLVYAGYQLTMIYMEYSAAVKEYDAIENYMTDETVNYVEDYNQGYGLNPDFSPSQIDWAGLVEVNSEIYAWIEFESSDLNINYPVAHSSATNEYYLKHTVNGTENSSGSIYIDKGNNPYFSDTNTLIYGHNMKNGTMFGNLKKYKKEDFYKGHEYFWIYTPDSRCRYEIFACYETAADSDTYQWWTGYCDEYTQYLQKSKSSSWYDTGVSVEPEDRIVTLSTCTGNDANRFIVQAKLVYSEVR